MITTTALYKRFGKKCVFQDANITVESGSICGLVGINGAGKSTLLRILSGVMRADSGEVAIDGHPVYENEEVKKQLFFLPDDPYYDFNTSGAGLRELYKTFYAFDDALFREYIDKFSLDIHKPLRNFSKGMKRQTIVSAALACRPKYLYLDEAFDGLDPLARLEFKRGIIDLQGQGSTVIIASHSLRELEDICDSFILIDNTVVKMNGNIDRAIGNTVKLQIAFDRVVERQEIPFDLVHYERNGRILTIVAHGDKEQLVKQLEPLHPLIVDEIPMDFEDLFISEVQDRGYLK